MGNEEEIISNLYGMIGDVNANEISDQIYRDNLSMWCNTWRITSKEIVKLIEKSLTNYDGCDTINTVDNSTKDI